MEYVYPKPPSTKNRKKNYYLLQNEKKIKILEDYILQEELKYNELSESCIYTNNHFNSWIKKLQDDNKKLQDDNKKLQDDNKKLQDY